MGSGCSKKQNLNRSNDVELRSQEILFYEELLHWKCNKKLDSYHWWPMKDGYASNVNNLYCEGGGLHKYDHLFNTKSVDFQKEHYFRSRYSNLSDAGWAGFCDKASILSCLYEYPKHSVRVSVNNQSLIFSPLEIEMLMIVSCDNSVEKNMLLFLGERHNSNNEDSDKNEPYPSQLLHFLRILCLENEPFVMDIDDDVSVWNYSYDSVSVTQHQSCPIEHNLELDLYSNNIKYLNFKIESSAYPEKNQDLWGYSYITTHNGVTKENEGWISDSHPDFLWKKYAKETPWTGQSRINPQIDCSIVYKIYKQSLTDNNNTLEFTQL